MKRFATPASLKSFGILGINSRNHDYISRYNNRRFFHLVDDKIITKTLAQRAGVNVPELIGKISYTGEVKGIQKILRGKGDFVIKPARGSGGGGILVADATDENGLRKASGKRMTWPEVHFHLNNILTGMYSLGGDGSDTAVIEERLHPHSIFKTLAFSGVPDVRIIVFRGVPVMAMLRLPTSESDGKANLHTGGVGTGVNLSTGVTTYAVQHNKLVTKHPDFLTILNGLALPGWENVLVQATDIAAAVPQLGYVGVDIVIDEIRGPTLLELNARPGIAVQIANRRGLAPVLAELDSYDTIPETTVERIALAKEIFAKFQSPEKKSV